ncbi:MAG: putative motility protein [Rhodospirillales bacterium]|nr:putative motility protein [Rhodospirillales bacterium]
MAMSRQGAARGEARLAPERHGGAGRAAGLLGAGPGWGGSRWRGGSVDTNGMSGISSIGADASLSQAQVKQQVGVAVARKALDAAQAQGDAAVSLLQQAADLQGELNQSGGGGGSVGQNIDVRA